jgi:Flp pilus assembly protein TadD
MQSFARDLDAALAAYQAGRFAEAEGICRRLAAVAPRDPQVLFLLGMAAHKAGRSREAISWLEQAASIEPVPANVFNGLGCAWRALGDNARAAGYFVRAIQIDPKQPDLHYSLGNACYALGKLEEAAAQYGEAVTLNPRDHECWSNLGKALTEINRVDEAIAAYDRAVALQPEYVVARCNRAITLLTAGRLSEGWREYEWRWRALEPRRLPRPKWNGEVIAGKSLLLLAEQGFGDTIQFARYAQCARERGARVILECRAPLKRLLEYSGCADAVVAYGEPLPDFDFHAPAMSVPGILGTTLENIPGQQPYLKAPAPASFPSIPAGRLKVGLAWAGNPGHHNDQARSLRLEQLAPLLGTPDVTFFSLQVPCPPRDEADVRAWTGFEDLTAGFDDFLDTASVCAQMDLVIAVDTAVAHLAGALGRTTWTLLPHAPDWRWLLNRSDTPWYPTMTLFRQRERNQWAPVIEKVAEALRSFNPAARTIPSRDK